MTIHAVPFGTVATLANTGNLAADLANAVVEVGGDELCPLTEVELDRCIRHEHMVRGLQAEAGIGTTRGFVLVLHSHSETFPNGQRVGRWLTFSQTPAGDAVYWHVGVIRGSERAVAFATLYEADNLLVMLRAVGGRPTAVYDNLIEVPAEGLS